MSVSVERKSYSYEEMFELLYTTDIIGIDVTSNGVSVKDSFIAETIEYYFSHDLQEIYNYMLENDIVISIGQPEIKRSLEAGNVRVITTAEYTSADYYAVVYGTSPVNPNVQISLPIVYNLKVTVPYDFGTGQISGTLRSPRVVITGTDGNADYATASSVQYSVSITNGGYSVYYSNISFVVTGYLWPYDPQTYNRYYDPYTISFTPAA